MPIPAAPAPASTIRVSARDRPVARRPARTPASDHGRGALDVVVEARDAVLVAVEQAQRVVLLEVLELDQAARPDLVDPDDERLDQGVVLGAAQARRPIAEVQRIGEQRGIVGPDVERHGERQGRVDAAAGGVQRELADRDGHAAGALVAQPEDPFVVGHHDESHVLERALAEDLGDAPHVGRGDPGPAGAPDDVAELLARPPDRRRVDDRQELLEMLREQSIEQRRVAILERGEADVLLEGVVLDPQVLELELDLLVDGQDAVGEQSAQPERLALVGREGQVLRQQPRPEEGRAGHPDPCRTPGRDVVVGGGQGAHGPSIVGRMDPLPTGFRWPDGVRAAAMFSFDLDAEAVMLADHPEVADYLDVIAHQRYGPKVAVPRLLRMLERRRLRTTFFVPGWVADTWPDVVRSVRDAGHEIGHHGYLHESVRGVDEATEEGYLVRGLEALDRVLGLRPVGYRAPSWDMNYRTPALLARHGFRYDAGLMDSDHPYRLGTSSEPGAPSLVELPVHWSLDDWNRWNYVPGYAASPILRPSVAVDAWAEELDAIVDGRRALLPDDAPLRLGPAGARRGDRAAHRAGPVDGRRVGRGGR